MFSDMSTVDFKTQGWTQTGIHILDFTFISLIIVGLICGRSEKISIFHKVLFKNLYHCVNYFLLQFSSEKKMNAIYSYNDNDQHLMSSILYLLISLIHTDCTSFASLTNRLHTYICLCTMIKHLNCQVRLIQCIYLVKLIVPSNLFSSRLVMPILTV